MAIKRHATKYNLLQKLSEADKNITHPDMILGTSGTTFGNMMSPQRVPMYVKHFVQHMTLEHPTFPRVFTGTENLYGDISTYYIKPKERLQVMKVVKKFPTDHVSSVFVKNLETGEYDVIERVDAKSLTEVFGFSFNNDRLDRLEENEVVEPGTVLSRSTGYDEYNNHCIGTNAMAIFSFHPNLTEDAAVISQSFVERTSFTKLHSIEIRIPPQNMIPLNIHGDKDHYKAIPDIGDEISDVVCALRTISITQMAELTNERLMQINRLQDMVYTCKGEVVDIDIYVNGDIPESPVYDQIRTYIEYQRKYYKTIYEYCQSIKREPRTMRLMTLYQRAKDFVNEAGMWIEKNIIKTININITIKERVYMTPGQKITGRYGNKSVISIIRKDKPDDEQMQFTIVSDDRMPVLPDGRRIDVMLNALSVFNRNITFALYETYINAMFDRFLAHIKEWKVNDQFDFIMNAIRTINSEYADQLLEAMDKTNMSKKGFMDSLYDDGVYIEVIPFLTTETLRDSIVKLFKENQDILRPEKLKVWYPARQEYVDTILPCMVGDMYIMVLKQDAIKGASARNAGAVSPEGLPIKSNAKSRYLSDMSDTALKLGEYDRLTFNIGVTNEELIKYIMLTRASVEGRGWLEKAIYNPDTPLPDRFENRAVAINNCYLNVLGVSLDLVPRQNMLTLPSSDTLKTYTFRNTVITMSEYDMYWMYKIALRYDRIRKKELKKGREYDNMDIWRYAFADTDLPEGWLDEEKKKILIQFVDDILMTNK